MQDRCIISNSIAEIIGEFMDVPDEEKENFDITGTDGYEELVENGLVLDNEVEELERVINDIVLSYGELFGRFGEKF